MAIVLDPDGYGGNPEIAYLTGHTSASGTATILRGQEGTTARAHIQDTPWVHSATSKDFDAAGGGVGLIGLTSYAPGSDTTILNAGTSTSVAAVDSTNLTVAFTAPPSGKVLVRLSALTLVSTVGNSIFWGLLDGSNAQVGKLDYMMTYATAMRASASLYVSGLTAGTAYTYKWAYKVNSGNASVFGGPTYGDAIMEVWAVNI